MITFNSRILNIAALFLIGYVVFNTLAKQTHEVKTAQPAPSPETHAVTPDEQRIDEIRKANKFPHMSEDETVSIGKRDLSFTEKVVYSSIGKMIEKEMLQIKNFYGKN